MNTDLMFSSKDQTWETPIDFFNKINEEFNFNLDVCASEFNCKCDNYFDEIIDGLNSLAHTSKLKLNSSFIT